MMISIERSNIWKAQKTTNQNIEWMEDKFKKDDSEKDDKNSSKWWIIELLEGVILHPLNAGIA